jgi:hypothetical protein
MNDDVSYSPTASNYDYDYYLLPPGTDYSDYSVKYTGITTNKAYYTSWPLGQNSFSSFSTSLSDDINVPTSLLRDTLRFSSSPFFDPQPYPGAVRIGTTYDPSFSLTRTQPISLHMDHSFTFLAEENVEYWGWVNSSSPFLLDVYSRDNTQGSIFFDSATQAVSSFTAGKKRVTFPVFPLDGSSQNFTVSFNDNTLVTLTPHPWSFPEYIPTIDVNTSIDGDIMQGGLYEVNQNTGEMSYLENDIFSIRMFNLSLLQDEYYKIFVNIAYDTEAGLSPTTPTMFLVGNNFEEISGSFNQDGYLLYSGQSENVTLVLYSPGYSRTHYSIFFENISPISQYSEQSLPLNTNITMKYETFYTFTLDRAHMMAINWTSNFDFTFYTKGANPGEWLVKTDESFFNPETGNLVGNHLNDLDFNWRYIPAGTYAIEVTDYSYDGQIRFTTIPVIQPTESPIAVDESSIYAFEFPLTWNRINLVNISTDDHINQSIRYEWSWISKYFEQIPNFEGDTWIGNQQINGLWEEYGENNTMIYGILPTRSFEVPIFILHAYEAENITDPMNVFSATLTVSNSVPENQSFIPFSSGDIGDGFFIPQSAVSSSTSYMINADVIQGADQLIGIPLNLVPFSIYNITMRLTGNFTDSNLNASFEMINMHGGNLNNLVIFNEYLTSTTDTSDVVSMLILTVSPTSYLYLDVIRSWNGTHFMNSTLDVMINQLPVTAMDFAFPTHEYNSTPSSQELLITSLEAAEMIRPSASPGFEMVTVVVTLFISINVKRRRRSK